MAKDRGGAPVEGARVDTVAADGAAVTAVGTHAAATAVAQAEAVGGAPAAGQGRAAELVEGAAVREVKVPDGGDAPRPHPAEGVATFPRPTAEDALRTMTGAALADVDRGGAPRLLDAQGRVLARAAVRRGGRDDFLPLAGPVIDPSKVPGVKVAKVTAPQLRRHGRTFVAGEPVDIDFRAHTELVPIGAIEATPWGDLPDHHDD